MKEKIFIEQVKDDKGDWIRIIYCPSCRKQIPISEVAKAIFDEELFLKKFTKTERESLEKKYGVK